MLKKLLRLCPPGIKRLVLPLICGVLLTGSAAVSASLSRAGEADHSAGGRDGVRLGNCERLLGESAALLGEGQELAGEGAALSARLSADKDTLKAGAR